MSIVAHLDGSGGPTASVFDNDTSEPAVGSGRLTVRHLAAAPAVDVSAGGAVAFGDVANGHSAASDLPAATYEASLDAAGTATQAFPDAGGAFCTDDVRTRLQLGITTGTSPTTYSLRARWNRSPC